MEVVDGDFSRGVPVLPGDLDVVFHSAATVSFDPPIDEGFQTNLYGATNLYQAVVDSGSRPCLVHVSTAYVAGVQKGVIPEQTLDHKVDYRLEAELALWRAQRRRSPISPPRDPGRVHGQGQQGALAGPALRPWPTRPRNAASSGSASA